MSIKIGVRRLVIWCVAILVETEEIERKYRIYIVTKKTIEVRYPTWTGYTKITKTTQTLCITK